MKKFIISVCAVVALCVMSLTANAGRLGGATNYLERCGPGRAILATEIFQGGQPARVFVYGSDQENLTVTVTDIQGRTVMQASGKAASVVEWYPEQTQSYRIVVTSKGEIESHVSVSTN